LRGILLEQSGRLRDAEEQYSLANQLQPSYVTWSILAACYKRQGRREAEIDAWKHAIDFSPDPSVALLSLGYAELDDHNPQQALQAFNKAMSGLPRQPGSTNSSFQASLAHGRALAWSALGDLKQAVSCEEETVRLAPDSYDDWLYLADLYDREGRITESQQARQRAAASRLQRPSDLQP
jgi:tetratricopeptide (TPR) repeat protein